MRSRSGFQALLANFTSVDFKRLIRAKRVLRMRDAVAAELDLILGEIRQKEEGIDRLDRKIIAILGQATKGSSRRNTLTLEDMILKSLRSARKPLALTELAKKLLDMGYRTMSAFGNFRTSVAHALKKMGGQLARTEDGYSISARKRQLVRKASPTKSSATATSRAKPARKTEAVPALATS